MKMVIAALPKIIMMSFAAALCLLMLFAVLGAPMMDSFGPGEVRMVFIPSFLLLVPVFAYIEYRKSKRKG